MKTLSITILLTLINLISPKAHDMMQKDTINVLRDSLVTNRNGSLIEPVSAPLIVPSSPQSALFEQHVDFPVTEYNGLPFISIPLYEIEMKGLKIPITLSYYAKGIKYDQYDGEVGVGWTINVGGLRVSRTVYGKDDEVSDMFNSNDLEKYQHINRYNHIYMAKIGLSTPFYNRFIYQPFDENWDVEQDSEYDQFTYMLPSSNGNFIITDRKEGKVALMEQNFDKIELNKGKTRINLNEIKITDKSGFTYYMGGDYSEKINEKNLLVGTVYSPDLGIVKTSWPLNKIISPYNEQITFKYKQFTINPGEVNLSVSITEAPVLELHNNGPSISNPGTQAIIYDPAENIKLGLYEDLLVDVITGIKENIVFVRGDNNMIQEINIKSKNGNLIKKIKFEYSIKDSYNWHTQLKSINVQSGDEELCKKTQFEYYLRPGKLKKEEYFPDQWGYYRVNYSDKKSWARVFLHKEFSDVYIFTEANNVGGIMGNCGLIPSFSEYLVDRSLKLDTKANEIPSNFTLKKIIYPTQGFTEYEYENNEYKSKKGAGLRIKRILANDGKNENVTDFQYYNGASNMGYFDVESRNFINWSCSFDYNWNGGNNSNSYWIYSTYNFSEKSFLPDINVSYGQVKKTQKDVVNTKNNGTTISNYELDNEYTIGPLNYSASSRLKYNPTSNYNNNFITGYYQYKKPLLISKTYLNNDNDTIQKEQFNYLRKRGNEFKNIKVVQRFSWPSSASFAFDMGDNSVDYWTDKFYDHGFYYIHTGIDLLSSKTTTSYTKQGKIKSTESYLYDSHNQLKEKKQSNSLKSSLVSSFKYPYDYTDDIYRSMVSQNMISPVIEQTISNNGKEINKVKTNYINETAKTKGLILPNTVQTTIEKNTRTDLTYDLYDKKGNLLQYTGKDEVPISYLWSYNGQYPIAEIINASYKDVSGALDVTPESISELNEPDMSKVDALRIKLPNAQVTSYTYKPLVGMLTATDPRGVITYYEYDGFGRLKETYIKENGLKKILQTYDYHYSTQK